MGFTALYYLSSLVNGMNYNPDNKKGETHITKSWRKLAFYNRSQTSQKEGRAINKT